MSFTKAEIEERGHPVWAEIDLGALKHNVRVLRETAGRADVMAVVKGYAYGHGNPECAQAALQAGATRIGVARVAEAIHLRESGVAAPIHVFTEPPPQAAATLVALDLTPAIYTEEFARALSDAATAARKRIAVHVKLDTGMHRVGLLADDIPDVIERIARLPSLDVEGVWSHLAVADVPDHPFTRKQLELFDELTGRIARAGIEVRFRHIANSAATLSLPNSHLDLVRCGIAIYGLWPSVHLVGSADLKPVLSLRSRLTMSKEVPAGDALSYGLRYELRKASRVVTVPTGYADGYDRRLSGRADVLIGGKRYRISGTVCMDQFMVDVGDDDIQAGEVATLIGADDSGAITAEELAGLTETINYEVTARIPSRVPRVFMDG
ncbi:MAG TPA: alanine racemase [Actinomycetota bacterium]|nr:alanine racemase [Actinomycetota bacterium]